MSVTCQQDFTIGLVTLEDDMPIDQAVYASGTGKIYGARAGYVFEFNATTGAKTDSAQIWMPAWGNASLAYDSGTNKLFVTQWNTQKWNDSGGANYDTSQYKQIIKVDASTLAVDDNSYITSVAPWGSKYTFPYSGPHNLIAHNGELLLVFATTQTNAGITHYLISLDPTTLAVNYYLSLGADANASWFDMCVQPVNGAIPAQLWLSTDDVGIASYELDGTFNAGNTYWTVRYDADFGAAPYPITYGVCWAASVGKVYATTRTQRVVCFTPSTGPYPIATTSFNTGDTTATPYRCRYCDDVANPFYQKILVPGMTSNNVVVIDPSTNGCTIKTGFDGPVDIVFTPTKAFAVQHGLVALKEITL